MCHLALDTEGLQALPSPPSQDSSGQAQTGILGTSEDSCSPSSAFSSHPGMVTWNYLMSHLIVTEVDGGAMTGLPLGQQQAGRVTLSLRLEEKGRCQFLWVMVLLPVSQTVSSTPRRSGPRIFTRTLSGRCCCYFLTSHLRKRERIGNLAKVTQAGKGRTGFWPRRCGSIPLCL